jgi:hypothetical protein
MIYNLVALPLLTPILHPYARLTKYITLIMTGIIPPWFTLKSMNCWQITKLLAVP